MFYILKAYTRIRQVWHIRKFLKLNKKEGKNETGLSCIYKKVAAKSI